jgi:GAF domain-containing protein
MEISEQQVEQWLLQNKEAARKLYSKHHLDVSLQRKSSILRADTPPPLSNNLYESFFEIAKLLNTCLDVKLIVHYVLKTASTLIKAEKCSVFLLDKEKQELYTIAFDVDKDGKYGTGIRVPVGMGIVGSVAQKMEGVNIEDAYKEPLFNPEVDHKTGFRTRSMLCLPIMDSHDEAEPELLGVACLINKIEDHPQKAKGQVSCIDVGGVLSIGCGHVQESLGSGWYFSQECQIVSRNHRNVPSKPSIV